jgi:hypothetical protein
VLGDGDWPRYSGLNHEVSHVGQPKDQSFEVTMRSALRRSVFATVALAVATAVTPAYAKCTRLAYSVNDYGKVGPTEDAKRLLDKYIADWTKERGIKGYRVGKKDVTCTLFLDVIIFDEYTCKAEASVCWNEGPAAPKATPAAAPAAAPKS